MSAKRSAGTSRSLLFINTLLLSTALALPAMAQIEEVVVTAQKKTEDVQKVPINVTAFTGQDLKTQQIDQFKDLQFHAPNVTYTAGNFGGADFQIRGVGVTAVGYDSESGVAIDFDEVYLSAPQLTEGSFFDLSGVEVLAGPQSTLYGRGATGGVVNLNIAKPDLSTPAFELSGSIGNYNAYTVNGVVNLPIITDQLGIRVSGEWDKRDGYVTNLYDNDKVDGLDQYSFRGTLRWQPTDRTTIDITGQFSREDDSHMRADKQLCTTDPTGVLGCLPTSAGTGIENSYSNLSVIASSQQGLTNFFTTGVGLPPATASLFGSLLGLYNLQSPNTLPAGYTIPEGARQIDTDFTPVWQSADNFMSLKWSQNVTHWLDSTLVLGYDRDSYYSQESYNNIAGETLPTNTNTTITATGLPAPFNFLPANCVAALLGSPNLNCAQEMGPTLIAAVAQGAGYPAPVAAAYAAKFYGPGALLGTLGELPLSGIGNLGTVGGNYTLTNKNEAFDQSDGESSEYSAEWRLNTSFNGPLNGMLGFYYLHSNVSGDYYVNAPTLDYPAIILGEYAGLASPAGCVEANGCILGPGYYHNEGTDANLTSKAIFGEVYYDAIPDTLKVTLGLRYTDDIKSQVDRIELYSTLLPIGTTSDAAVGVGSPNNLYDTSHQEFERLTGRAVVDWTPKLSFTDSTLVYASFAHGYKAGGANPGIEASNNPFDLPLTYKPEYIDAYELGTKNNILGNTLQANGDVYYYDYSGLQVSAIESNTSINKNIDAHVWGAEGNFLWAVTDRLQFNLNLAHEESSIQNTSLVDTRNPTAGDPNTLLIKDDTVSGTTGGNCVVYFSGAMPSLPAGYSAPVGGIHALSSYGVANAVFGSCQPSGLAALQGAGFNLGNGTTKTTEGEEVSLDGNELQNTPSLSVSLGGQYTQPLPGDYSLVARVDVHWQSHFWMRVFEQGADHVGSEEVANASLQLNSPDDVWYIQAFIRNIFAQNNITGGYLTSETSGLYTNAFYGDPRTYGVKVGIKF